MKKVYVKLMSVLLAVTLLLGSAPLAGLAGLEISDLFSIEPKALTSGSYTYTVSNNQATITGYSGTASNLSIPSSLGGYTVTKIDQGVFKNNSTLVSVQIPSTIVSIASSYNNGAFQGCSKLETVTFAKGSSDAEIGTCAFMNCTSLTSVNIPGNYKTIGTRAFMGCYSLKSMKLEKSSYSYANQTIKDNAFHGCTNLTSISLPTTLKKIEASAFRSCTSLTNVVVPEGVTVIEYGSFWGCTKLTTVSLPSTLTDITSSYNDGAFQGCSKLETVTFAKGSSDAKIGTCAFMDCTSLTSINIPGNYTTIGTRAFMGCYSVKSLTIEKSSYSYANQIIGDNAFHGCSNLSKISLPTTLKKIEASAFRSCTSLTNVVVPEGVTVIENGSFWGCTKLTAVSLPSTLTDITSSYNDGAFQGCSKLETVTFAKGSSDAKIGTYAFMDCTSLTSINIPGNYTTIGTRAFMGCYSMKSLTIEKSSYSYANQIIGDNAFHGCSNLLKISLPTTLKKIEASAFRSCTSLTNVVVPEGVTVIENGSFWGCTKLTTVSLPSTLTDITSSYNDGAFQGCSLLEKVFISEGESDLKIGIYTFNSCAKLNTVHIPMNTVSIGNYAFDGSKTNLTICSHSSSSYGKTYADANGIKFKVCDSHEAETYTVSFNAKGGSVSPSSITVQEGESLVLPIPSKTATITFDANGGVDEPSAITVNFTCKGWSTSAASTTATYNFSSTLTPKDDMLLYAVWSNKTITLPSEEPTREGYYFLGWSNDPKATEAEFSSDESVKVTDDSTLYAVWSTEEPVKKGYAWWEWIIIIVFFGWIWYI